MRYYDFICHKGIHRYFPRFLTGSPCFGLTLHLCFLPSLCRIPMQPIKLVISALIPTGSPTIGSQYQYSYLRRLIDRFTFVQLPCPLLTGFIRQIADAFCLLTHAVQYQPLEREAPQGELFAFGS